VGQCSTFEGKINKVQFGVVGKKIMLPQLFFYFWAGQVVKYTLGAKFGSPIQKWGWVGLGEGRIVANNGRKGFHIDHGR
jgi:hypothetical protein